jgi:hypothetical protein
MTRETEHASVIMRLRDELGALRAHGGISEQFADWHRRLIACLHAITAEIPSCASLCEELKTVNYELPPEIEHGIPGELPGDPIVAQASRVFFQNQCDRATELIRTILWSLRTAK